MDDKTLQALTALAVKLGTTAEYLWGVLLKQALLTGVTRAAVMLGVILACVSVARLIRKSVCPEDPDGRVVVWVFFGVVTTFVVGVCAIELVETVTALVNPEFWALQQILRAL